MIYTFGDAIMLWCVGSCNFLFDTMLLKESSWYFTSIFTATVRPKDFYLFASLAFNFGYEDF